MRILIIGGTRFIGPHVVMQLMGRGHDVTIFHRGQTQHSLPDDVIHIFGDRRNLLDFKDTFRHFTPQLVLDMIPLAESDAHEVMHTFKGMATRVVAISSQDVYLAYGRLIGTEPGPVESIPLHEESPLRTKLYPYREGLDPDHPLYDYEKILAEHVFLSDPDLPGTILRLPMVYGPRDPQHRLYPYVKRMADVRPVVFLEQGLSAWRWTKGYVENVAAAIVLAVTNDRAAGRIYNVGDVEALSEADWVQTIGAAAGWQGKIVTAPNDLLPDHLKSGSFTDQHLVFDTSRIREELAFQETISHEEGLQRTITWELANPPAEVDPSRFDYAAENTLLANL